MKFPGLTPEMLERGSGPRGSEQLVLVADTKVFAWGFNLTFEDALERARQETTGEITLVGRRRMNDYVGSPIWGETLTYGTV